MLPFHSNWAMPKTHCMGEDVWFQKTEAIKQKSHSKVWKTSQWVSAEIYMTYYQPVRDDVPISSAEP